MTTFLAGLAGGAVVIGLVCWTICRASSWEREDDEITKELERWRNGK